jgi:imidazole glycerol-phosphate synthase subunit HisF
MLHRRIIPSLLLERGRLVKTERFRKPKYVGDPINAVKIFNEKEVDELFLLDIGASREGTRPNFALLEQIATEAFMPVCYGGGVRSVEDARTLLQLGIEKVALNTAALQRIALLGELRDRFGAQCVVGIVDVKRKMLGGNAVFSHAGASTPERDPVRWASRLVEAGAGEILLQSVDHDGTMQGFDLDLLRTFDRALEVPLVAAGGAGSVEHMRAALGACRLSGLAIGARFVYQGPHRAVLISYLSPGEIASLH